MTRPSTYTQTRYLEAKRTVDDRALHRPTLDAIEQTLDDRATPTRLVEVGCGTGAMLRRLLAWNVLSDTVVYHGFDLDPAAVERAATALSAWGAAAGYAVDEGAMSEAPEVTGDEAEGTTVTLTDDRTTVRATFAVGDAVAQAHRLDPTYHLLVGCAVFDLLTLEDALEPLVSLVPGGLVYAPITFDGETFFRSVASDGDPPTVRQERERAVIAAYHETMDAPSRPGGSRTGRTLLEAFPAAGCRVRAAGAAGWLVTPPYPDDEAYFLHHLIDGIESAVIDARAAVDVPEGLTREAVRTWADRRHRAVSAEALAYGAHNLDVLAAVPDA